jgi:hypothetical protein
LSKVAFGIKVHSIKEKGGNGILVEESGGSMMKVKDKN